MANGSSPSAQRGALEDQLRQVLKALPTEFGPLAFSAEEVAERLQDLVGRGATVAEVGRQLEVLREAGAVESKDLGDRRWYIIASGG